MQQKDKIEMHIFMDAFQINVDHVINLFVLHFLLLVLLIIYLFSFIPSFFCSLVQSAIHSYFIHSFIHTFILYSFVLSLFNSVILLELLGCIVDIKSVYACISLPKCIILGKGSSLV